MFISIKMRMKKDALSNFGLPVSPSEVMLIWHRSKDNLLSSLQQQKLKNNPIIEYRKLIPLRRREVFPQCRIRGMEIQCLFRMNCPARTAMEREYHQAILLHE